jgi:hypothetical protein
VALLPITTTDQKRRILNVAALENGTIVWLHVKGQQFRFEAINNHLLLKEDSYTDEIKQVNAMYAQQQLRKGADSESSLRWYASSKSRRAWERSSRLQPGNTLLLRATGFDSAVVVGGQIDDYKVAGA